MAGAFARIARMPVVVESVAIEELVRGERESTLVRVTGADTHGLGEDVTHDKSDIDAFRRLDHRQLVHRGTVEELCRRIDLAALARGVRHPVVAHYRRWAIESAMIDLALRQARLSLAAALGLEARPVSFVVSPRRSEIDSIQRLLEQAPGTRLKLDPRSGWTRELITALAELDAVDILDLKGTYPGTPVYQPPDARLYRDLLEACPYAWIEDPAVAPETAAQLEAHRERIAWDEPVHSPADLDRLSPVAAVNVKPSRLGSLEALLETVARCRVRGIAVYGGGQSEIGPGRGQIQLLAALLYPDAPNDVAPIGYDDGTEPDGVAAGPLVQPESVSGFRWA